MSTSGMKSSLLYIKPPRIRRKHLRKYSWLPDVLRVKNSIISRIFGPVLTVTLFAVGVVYAHDKGYDVTLTNSVVPLLAVVVGLILVFRNGTSYDRFWEGRKCFGALTANIRNLSRLIWINVALPPTGPQPENVKGKTPVTDLTEEHLRKRKIDTLHLLMSFAFAVRHYLRGEDGTHWDDLESVLPATFTQNYDESRFGTIKASALQGHNSGYAATATGSTREGTRESSESESQTDATKRVRVKRSKPKLTVGVGAETPLLPHRSVEFGRDSGVTIPLPLLIAHDISRKIFRFRRDGFLETFGPAGANAMSQLVQSMVEQLTVMERIANTPIPKAYGIHLKQCVTLYLFSLPFTMVKDLGWGTVPIVTVVAFTFMGIEGIADEIEMPFGSDDMDLPLDRYCHDLKEELDYMIDKLPEGGPGAHGYDDGEGDD